MNQKREFTGVWIPRQILEDTELTSDEKMLFADIASFNECFMLNSTLAARYGCSERTIQDRIKKLKDKGYIKQISFDGRTRKLQALHHFAYQTREISHPCPAESRTPDTRNLAPIDNNIDNNTLSDADAPQDVIVVVEDKPPAKKPKDTRAHQVFQLFKNNYPANWKINKTQNQAAINLLEEKGIEKIKNALDFHGENRKLPFCPSITTPYDLDSKWSKLVEFKKKHYGSE